MNIHSAPRTDRERRRHSESDQMPRLKTAFESPKAQAILDAALELFADRGFHGTTIPEVAKKAKVGLGTMYRYFASKDKLVNFLYQECKSQYSQFVMGNLEITQDARKMFDRIWKRMWAFYAQNETVVRFMELHHHGSYLDKKSVAMEEAVLQPIEAFVLHHQELGRIAQRPARLLMAMVYGTFLGMVHGALRQHLIIDDETISAAGDALWTVLAPARART
jgi:TetR/AcrR family transcriptional regulator, repressor of fatR-cypB operon